MSTPLEFTTPYPQPPLADTTTGKVLNVDIVNTQYQFSPDGPVQGVVPSQSPIFGTNYSTGTGETVNKLFGLPFFKFQKGRPVRITFTNKTGYSFDLHWHGLNTPANTDGATEILDFGTDTFIGQVLNQTLPPITNNSTMLWVHAHNMFMAADFTYTGVYGGVFIEDEISKPITDLFEYADNHLMMINEDVDYFADGTLNNANIYTDENRGCFSLINGVSAINWYKDGKAPYTTQMFHNSTKNLLKIDFLNAPNSFRYMYLGVCDRNDCIKSFYLVQSDVGFRNPSHLTMIGVAPAQRVAFIVDLSQFEGREAYLFAYNFDLTEVFTMTPNDQGLLVGLTQDLTKTTNPTPNPTPIPDDQNNPVNPQGDPSQLDYPVLPLIPQVTELIPFGNVIAPQQSGKPFTIKKFLKLTQSKKGKCKNKDISLSAVIKAIRQLVFGDNYEKFKDLIKIPNFEFNNPYKINYVSLLNPDYFYNLPDISNPPVRNFVFIPEDTVNANVPGGNPYGQTEVAAGANRIFVDAWNSKELDLNFALAQWEATPNNYKPDVLPTYLFKIAAAQPYINAMGNNTLTFQIYDTPVAYTDTTPPLAQVTVTFPSTDKPINIVQWVALANSTFASTNITVGGSSVALSTLLNIDWTFYPYRDFYLTEKAVFLKSVFMKDNNTSPYYIRLIGQWTTLQFFGKQMLAMRVGKFPNPMFPNNLNANLQTMYPAWATTDPNTQIPTPDGNAELIIPPGTTFLGMLDGFQSDFLMNFSVQQESSEKWIYQNLDTEDSHPFHFHLTSCFPAPQDPATSPNLVDDMTLYYPHLYSIDTVGIPSQNSIAWYLKFLNYSSEDAPFVPAIPYLGYMYHCHYMEHHDMNMMGEYYVYPQGSNYF